MKSKPFKGLLILGVIGLGIYLYLRYRQSVREEAFSIPSSSRDKEEKVIGVVSASNGRILNSRQKQLVSLLSKSNGLTTTDILKQVSNITDRTLRRDMNNLIELGVVKKSGSTKSSKYYIKK